MKNKNDKMKTAEQNITLKRILELKDARGLEDTALEKELGLRQKQVADWKREASTSYMKMLPELSDYFDVSVDYLLGRSDNPSKYPDNLYDESTVTFPVIDAICAGYGGDNEFSPTGEELPVPKYLLKTHNPNDYFVLEVKGNSMYPLFMNGDKVLIRKCDSVDSGTVAAIGFDGEDATLKKVEYVKDGDWMRLIPRNPEYPTKVIKGADLEQCRIYGEVVYKFSDNVRF